MAPADSPSYTPSALPQTDTADAEGPGVGATPSASNEEMAAGVQTDLAEGDGEHKLLALSWWPPLGLMGASVLLLAMGVAMQAIGLLIAAVCAGALVRRARLGLVPMADGARGIATAAPFALVGPAIWASVPLLDPTLCVDPGPALFLLLWPASVLAMAVGAVVVGRVARAEGWSMPGTESIALWGLSGFCLALHLGIAGTWTCSAGAGSVLAAGFAAAWAIVAFSAARRAGAQGRG